MNILFLTSTFPRFKNDTQSPFVLEQAVAWKKAQPTDNVHILAPHDRGAKTFEIIDGVVVHRFRYMFPTFFEKLAYPALLPNIRANFLLIALIPFYIVSQIFSILNLLRTERIDTLYAHWFVPQGISAYIVLMIHKLYSSKRLRFVIHNHSSDVALLKKIPLFGLVILRALVSCADIIFCVNTKLTEEINSIVLNMKAKKPEVYTMPMGVSIEVPIGSSIRYDFAFIGRFVAKKGLDFFLDALLNLNKHGQFPTVAIAGGPQNEHYVRRIAQVKNAEYVGFVQSREKEVLLGKTRYVVLPSLVAKGDFEGLPVVLLEALVAGTGVVASRDTNIELLPEWNTIKKQVQLIKNPANVDEFATILRGCLHTTTNKRITLARYRWDRLIKEYIELIHY
ncbi:MAG: glycosyltransferase [Candidatus Roizmanbacteria bacterium]|nr:glycosyltransferase [Candidatus Roizmanbacteria bacterium]